MADCDLIAIEAPSGEKDTAMTCSILSSFTIRLIGFNGTKEGYRDVLIRLRE